MHLSSFIRIFFLLEIFVSKAFSAPSILSSQASILRNITRIGRPWLSSLIPNSNFTQISHEPENEYPIPHTQVTLFFDLGFPLDGTSMTNTIDSLRRYCLLEIQLKHGTHPLPLENGALVEDMEYGASITIVPAQPAHVLTWKALRVVLQGLSDYLIDGRRFMEAEFDIVIPPLKMVVGRGRIEAAPASPLVPRGAKEDAVSHQLS